MLTLASGFNPLRQIAACLLHKGYVAEDNPSLATTQFHVLSAQDHHLLINFATSLIEQIPKAKLSQKQRYVHLHSAGNNCRMKSVRPLRDASDDLAQDINIILHHEPWDVALVRDVLKCYRSWVEYAVRVEEVKVEILFSYIFSIWQ